MEREMSLERAVTVLVETVETADTHHAVPLAISLRGTVSSLDVLAALKVVLHEMRDRADVCVEALKAKIIVDHMYLEALLENQDLTPTIEGEVRKHLAWTRRAFPSCFARDLDAAVRKLEETLGEDATP